ncbi:hypothetical protein ACFVYP_33845 [Kitasatospora sp. NPDC058201]|uniref:hypothetical protein n=1 Tax=unclassified Kitasatospora TaxID=2633591 RepID=UPI0036484A80
MKELQDAIAGLLPAVVAAGIRPESCPAWLWRPGRVECAGAWEAVSTIYRALTGLVLPKQAPAREWRRLDLVLTYEDGQQQILEVDEKQHFTSARALTLEHYPSTVELGFDAARWPARSRDLTGREPGGGYAEPRPPLFPGDGGRHRQRAFRDAPADLLPAEHGWLPTVRISDTEVGSVITAPNPASSLSTLLGERGVPGHGLVSPPAVPERIGPNE